MRPPRHPAPPRRLRDVYYSFGHLVREGIKFMAVGGVGFVVDVSAFNLLRYAGGEGPLYDKPLTAKAASAVLATLVTYAGNRWWTFRHREAAGVAVGYALFFLLSAIGAGVALTCLGVSHYVLGLTSPLADNIAANVVGLALGTLFRFWSYRRFVFRAAQVSPPTVDALGGGRPS